MPAATRCRDHPAGRSAGPARPTGGGGQLLKGLEQHPDAVRTPRRLPSRTRRRRARRDLLERATEGPTTRCAAVGASSMIAPAARAAGGGLPRARDVLKRPSRPHNVCTAWPRPSTGHTSPPPRPRARPSLRRQRPRRCAHLSEVGTLRGSPRRSCRWNWHGPGWRWRTRWPRVHPEVAIAEAKAALEDFERLDAARHADAAGALLRIPRRTDPYRAQRVTVP